MSDQEAIVPAEESEVVKRPTSVLFVCGKNSIRSPIAELLARKLLPPNMYIASAGVQRGERDPFVDAVLIEEGLSLDARQPRGLEELADGYFDLIITLTPLAHHTVLERMRGFSVDVEYWPTPDPTLMTGSREQIMNAYRDVRDRLKRQITERLAPK
ncbi:low molecular weight phosphatase family protein [Ochrobactrum sp. MYb15]|uniref:arsenate-mycothiol transferase ArsC n=1 Tax=Brucella TaxID=234 RepID=UPI0004AEF3A1|nr:low molecular weight phosphatase family protein [Brucella rhizosphaerae]PQZ49269.1 low molecular weight phosphatase family protein [Ochrobactrum sp. MYb19]PRA66913.1 low molecular weight phosphatase family protein [Ochrobactrum sp. MYb18]PRA76057.1 low molecular weight phosphatase family protein [Brucella thiophenivorans]PRA91923.1 low molecular weight phosphatase family protein [Ochrobactrum sp. MYb14]PRA98065.1 low molecular weight phosphatase family protein [Ochrobactrum sp. MYb15]